MLENNFFPYFEQTMRVTFFLLSRVSIRGFAVNWAIPNNFQNLIETEEEMKTYFY